MFTRARARTRIRVCKCAYTLSFSHADAGTLIRVRACACAFDGRRRWTGRAHAHAQKSRPSRFRSTPPCRGEMHKTHLRRPAGTRDLTAQFARPSARSGPSLSGVCYPKRAHARTHADAKRSKAPRTHRACGLCVCNRYTNWLCARRMDAVREWPASGRVPRHNLITHDRNCAPDLLCRLLGSNGEPVCAGVCVRA